MRWSLLAVLLVAVVVVATECASGRVSPASASREPQITPSTRDPSSPGWSNLRFERISVEDGLSHSTVNCILQDSYGFMWFGTEDGLNRYDGHSFTVYRHNPDDPHSLSHNRVWSLYEDSAGALWVGTYGGGLNRFHRDTGQFARYDTYDFGNITDEPEAYRNIVWAIDEHPAGVVWIATYGGGLVRFDLETERFTSYAPDPGDPRFGGHEWITALLVDDSGMLWIGTHSVGLDRFDPTTGKITTYRHYAGDPDGLGHDWITEIVQDRSGAIWIGTHGGGLDRFDPETETFGHYRHDPEERASLGDNYIWSISEDPAGLLWIGTYGGGLDAFDPENGTFVHVRHDPTDPRSLSSNRTRAMHHDRSGILWVGTRGGGVSRSDPASARFTHYRGDLDDPQRPGDYQVLALLEGKDGTLWIGTAGGGLDALDRMTGEWRHFRHDPADPHSLGDNSIQAIHEDDSGIFWLATQNGFYRFDPTTGRFERLPHNPPDPGDVQRETIYTVAADQQGVLWLGTHGRGLSAYDPVISRFVYHLGRTGRQTGEGARDGLSDNYVHAVLAGPSGTLWAGTHEGLNSYDRETGRWYFFQHDPGDPNSLGHNWIESLYQDRSGMLWVGTLGGGLDRLDIASGTFSHYREQDGLANNMVLEILEGGGYLWICTANGLSMLDPDTETIENYDASDGLPINEFSAAYASESGELFVGGINGFMSFYPNQMVHNPLVPPVVLTSLQRNGVTVDTGKAPEDLREVTLRWPGNSFEFGFAALSYTLPDKNQHAYKLEGFDRDWNYIGNRRFGRYTNLPGGTYTLRLKGSNNDGVWNEEGKSIQVVIVPPFWQTWWFRGIVVLTLAGGVFGGYRLRVRSLEARSHELQRQVEERTAELRKEMDQRIRAEEALGRREREKAITEERNRLARELHDSVTQALYGVTLYSEAALGRLASGHAERAAANLTELQHTAHEALAEMRLLVFELRPPVLAEEGLVAALQARLRAVEGRAGLRTEFRTDVEQLLPPDVEEALYRIAVEALNNVLKHAQARNIKVHLRQQESPKGAVTLEVIDDGIGFDPVTALDRGGMGLSAMQERAAALGGRLTVSSKPGSGTRLLVVWTGDEEGEPSE